MSFTYPTVSLNGNDYSVYGDRDQANLYLIASVTADAFIAADDDTQSKLLVSSVRWLDTLHFLGVKADPAQELAFPRTGIPNVNNTTIPAGVLFAEFEIAAALAADPSLFTSISDPGIRSMQAGAGVGISFFRSQVVTSTLVPKAALAYLAPYLDSVVGAGGPKASGYKCPSPLDKPDDFIHGI